VAGQGEDLFVATDVHYLPAGGARAAAVVAADAAFSHLVEDRVKLVPEVQPYQPGQFYLRELPPLHAVLDGLTGMTLLVVDGYADLDPDGRPGLGSYAWPAGTGCPPPSAASTPSPATASWRRKRSGTTRVRAPG
jgi:deoxyinosine 3'endonuclease (endonuclease V)